MPVVRDPLTRIDAPVGLTGGEVQRRGQHRPALTPGDLLRSGERAEPGALGAALRTSVIRPRALLDGLRVPALLTQDLVHAVPPPQWSPVSRRRRIYPERPL